MARTKKELELLERIAVALESSAKYQKQAARDAKKALAEFKAAFTKFVQTKAEYW